VARWLKLKSRLDSSCCDDTTDGYFSYPDQEKVAIHLDGKLFLLLRHQSKLAEYLEDFMVEYKAFPIGGNYCYVNTLDLVGGVKDPQFLMQEYDPDEYKLAPKEEYELNESFGSF
jgi:hypothetical protein